jgi:hypothetical protein
VEQDVKSAINSWQQRTRPASYLQLNYLPATIPREVNALDRLQVVKFRSDSWCRPADSPTGSPVCYDMAAAAITTVTYQNKPMDPSLDGIIIDADIELNAVRNMFYDADLTPNPQPTLGRQASDLWNTLTHELGHLQGFDHTCRSGFDGIPSCTVDGQGKPVLSCGTVMNGRLTNPAYQQIFDSTMYPFEDPRETKKRIPKADDLSAVIEVYPAASDPLLCGQPAAAVASGCGLSGRPAASGVGAGLLAVLGILVGRRLRRRRAQVSRFLPQSDSTQ